MADKQPLNATFFAFRKRERGGVLLGALITYALIAFLVMGVFAALNWQAVSEYINWTMSMGRSVEAVDPNDPNAVFAAMMPPPAVMSLVPAYFLLMVVFYLLFAAYEAACLRWMIRGEVKGLFGLALDADTLRVYFTYWVWFFLLIALYFVVTILAVSVGVGAALSAGGSGQNIGATMVGVVLACFAVLFAVLFFAVRFAPAAATSIAKRRFAFFDAWTVTKGRFWALLGAFVLLFLMFLVGSFLLSIGFGVAMGMGLMGQFDPAAEPKNPQEAFALLASPGILVPIAVIYGLMIVGSFVFYVALFGINARAAQAALEEGKIQPAQ